jgi:hypothetical protein
MTTNVIVAGSRGITDDAAVAETIDSGLVSLRAEWPIEIVHGGADGVDTIAGSVAKQRGYDMTVFDPSDPDGTETEYDVDELGDAAFAMRNQEMAAYGDMLIAAWDGESPGTRNMIESALDEGLPMMVDTYDG